MNILHVGCGFSLDFQGGITNYIRNIAKTQIENGHTVDILTDSGENNGYNVINFPSINKSFSFYKKKDNYGYAFVEKLLKEKQYDLIHIHMVLNMDPRIYSLFKPYKYIVSLHDYFLICPRIQMIKQKNTRCESCSNKCYKCFNILQKNYFISRGIEKVFGKTVLEAFPIKSKSIFNRWFSASKNLLENAIYVLPVSSRVQEIYEKSNIQANYKMLHIGNFSANAFDDNYKYEKTSSEINMVLLSNVSYCKGGQLICSMLEKVHNPLLKIHYYGRLNKNEEEMLAKANIINHGSYQQKDLGNILSNLDMGIMVPIWEDNGPQVVMEMLNNHLPVFATKMGGIPDFVNSSNGFIFDPLDENEINKGIDFLNNLNVETISRLKRNIKRTLTPMEHYNELMKIYNKVIEME